MTAYIWMAYQTEPGMDGIRYHITNTKLAPKPPAPVKHIDFYGNKTGLVYDDSLYSEWELLGEINGRAYRTQYDEISVEMETPKLKGRKFTANEIVICGFYSKI